MLIKKEFQKEMVERCLDELYQASQPSISYSELIEQYKENPERQVYKEHYLSDDEIKCIVDKYLYIYKLEDPFQEYCDILIRDMTKGCSKDKYIKEKDEFPGYRGYESVPSLDNEIGKENLNKVVKFIEMRKNYYRFNREAECFKFEIFNVCPTSSKDLVIKTWKEKGVDITIVDRNPDNVYERVYYGLTDEEIENE